MVLGGRFISLIALGISLCASGAGAESLAGPDGWRALCRSAGNLCNTSPHKGAPKLDLAALRLLGSVNAEVNAEIRPRAEPAGRDLWQVAPRSGDCDDYAVTKKFRLIAKGWEAERLRFATMMTETDEFHVVLTVEAAGGALVLDNRQGRIMTLAALEARGYKLVAVEGEGGGGTWRATPYAGVAALLLAAAN